MERLIERQLSAWKERPGRKPLLVSGVRQVGKTWSITDFGKRYFADLLYVNLDTEPGLCDIFRRSKDPEKILFHLSALKGRSYDPKRTLIFFDEIQECNEVLNSLKYFCEADEEYYIIGAGSYLGITLSKGSSFPVGTVEMLEMKPMTYKEFLLAAGQGMLVDYMESIETVSPLAEPLADTLRRYLQEYYLVGGMPEAVKAWMGRRDLTLLDSVQVNIINSYYRDFSKYPPNDQIPRILQVWDSIVAQLSRENRKFKYSEIRKSARAREYEQAVNWLTAGHYLSRVNRVSSCRIPLKGYEDPTHFKTYMPDTGLLRNRANFPVSSFLEMKEHESIPFKGALAENYVLQELKAVYRKEIFYWTGKNLEIDFVLQAGDVPIPIEVKAGLNVSSRSLTRVLEQMDVGIRFSMRNLSREGKILNIPLPLVSEFQRLLG